MIPDVDRVLEYRRLDKVHFLILIVVRHWRSFRFRYLGSKGILKTFTSLRLLIDLVDVLCLVDEEVTLVNVLDLDSEIVMDVAQLTVLEILL